MTNREARFYLEGLQRMMTQYRGIFSDDFVCANGMSILALEQQDQKREKWYFCEDITPSWNIKVEKTWARLYKCTGCGFVHPFIESLGIYKYCPNCGAYMGEG